jgi:cephalosporin hydroxylase
MGEVLNPLPSWSSEETWQMFRNGLYHGVFRGAEIQKSADDLHRYQELVEISQPDIVIETGTRAGGSALYFRHEL